MFIQSDCSPLGGKTYQDLGSAEGRLTVDRDEIIKTLREHRESLAQFHVRRVSIFGSVVRREARPMSDVDILVEFEPGVPVGLFAFARLQRHLQEILDMEVDLATPNALHKALKKNILREAVNAF